jgi:predicted phosphodiesterase
MNEYIFEDRDWRSLERIATIADCDVLVFGHTHVPWDRIVNDVRFINAGSVGKPKDGDFRAGWLLLEITTEHVTATMCRVAYDVASTAAAIRASKGLPDHFASDIETGGLPLR